MALRRAKLPKATMNALFATPPLDYEAEFDEVRAGYPNQIGREQALKYYLADRAELGDETPGRIQTAKRNYLSFLKRPDQAWRQPQNLKTFFNNWRDWEVPAEQPKPHEQTREEMIRAHAAQMPAFIDLYGDPDEKTDARNRFEVWSAQFVRAGCVDSDPVDRWARWKAACTEAGVDPKGAA